MADLSLRAIQAELRAKESRCEVNASSDHVKAKISSAEQMKVHTMRVIGHRDLEANAQRGLMREAYFAISLERIIA